MNSALISLTAASIALVGSHFALSHPLRKPLMGLLGTGGFMAAYSIVAIGCMVWMYFAFNAAPAFDLPGSGDWGWLLASLITLPALALFIGSLSPRNPSMAVPEAEAAARAGPRGVFLVTRHPMMWSFALWGLSHLVLLWSWRTTNVALAIIPLALVGARLQDRRKRTEMGDAWANWEAQTSYHPRLGELGAMGWKLWLSALILWALLSWLHIPAGGIPAGIWRWLPVG